MDAETGSPQLLRADGRLRRIGVEIEFGGIDEARAAEVVRRLFGGRVEGRGPHLLQVRDTRLGDFEVELDTHFAQAEEAAEERGTVAKLKRGLAQAVGDVMQAWAPCEISSGPISVAALPRMDELAAALREAGAVGTGDAPHYAYALQLNPEVRLLQPGHVLRVLQSYLILEDWLRARTLRDLSRRASLFVRHFPDSYRRKVLQPDYAPGWEGLIRDYVADNGTRNRDLDLLPLFAHVQPQLMAELPHDERVTPRPTWHFRMPDCRLDEPGWSIGAVWQTWLEVERLAEDGDAFQAFRGAYLDWGLDAPRERWRDWVSARLPGPAAQAATISSSRKPIR